MKPAPFEHHAPGTVAEATALLAEHGDEAKVLAGGQSLVPLLALRLTRFGHLVDVNGVAGLDGVARSDGWLAVGAVTRQRDAERSAVVAAAAPLLARALPHIGHVPIRNRGTVGGSIAHADPSSELPAVAVALGAEVDLAAATGVRVVPAEEFFVATWTTAAGPEELVTRVRFPVWDGRTGCAVEEVARRRGDFALAGVAASVTVDDDGRVARVGLGVFGLGSTPWPAREAAAALVGTTPSPADLDAAGHLAVADAEPPDDIHASAAYRRRVGAHLVTRALARALEEAARA